MFRREWQNEIITIGTYFFLNNSFLLLLLKPEAVQCLTDWNISKGIQRNRLAPHNDSHTDNNDDGGTVSTQHVIAGKTAHLSFYFRWRSSSSREGVPSITWLFTPLATNELDLPPILLEAEFPVTRFSKTVRKANCTDPSLQNASTSSLTSCYVAGLSISNTLKADEGWYTGSVDGAEPVKTSLLLLVDYKALQTTPSSLIPAFPISNNSDPHRIYQASRQLRTEDSEALEPLLDSHLPADHDAFSAFFYAPPFVLVFNVNSSVCLGQNFTFHCSAEPNNYGIQLTLLKLGQHVVPADLESRLHPEGFHSTSNVSLIDSLTGVKEWEREGDVGGQATPLQNRPWEQEYESRQDIHYTVNINETGFEGGYLCVASVAGMEAARWSYMHLRVLDCGTVHGDSSQRTGLSFLLSPVVMSCLVLFLLLLLCLTVFIVLSLRARRNLLTSSSSSSSEWKPGLLAPLDSTVIREDNLLYHWTDTQKLLLGTAATATAATATAAETAVKRPTSLAATKKFGQSVVPPTGIISPSPSTDLGVALTSSDLGHTTTTPGGSGGSSSMALTRFDSVHWLRRLPSGSFAENPAAISPGYRCGRRSLLSDSTGAQRRRQFGVGAAPGVGLLPRRYSVDSDLSPMKRYREETASSSVPSSNSYMLLRPGTEVPGGGGCEVPPSTDHRELRVPMVIIHMDPNKRPGQAYSEGASAHSNITSSGYKLPVDAKWEVRRECIRLGHRIGAGAFGVVFVGSVKDGMRVLPGLRRRTLQRGEPTNEREPAVESAEVTVAVKTLRDNFTEQELADLVREMEILKQFDPHPHIVQLYGVCSQNGPLQVLVEFAPYGNLRDFLIVRRPAEANYGNGSLLCVTPEQLLNFGLQVARGMDYLSRLHIVHRDLAARNVLIGESYVAKIADFGLTRTACDYYRKCSDGRLPIKWMAPESIFDRRYTTKSDVWSFGILLWEIFSYGGTPYPVHSAESLLKALRAGLRNERPAAASTAVYTLMLACWETVPEKRPSFQALSASLSELAPHEQQQRPATAAAGSVPGCAADVSLSRGQNRSTESSVGSTVYLTLNAEKLHLEASSSVCTAGLGRESTSLSAVAAASTNLSPSSSSSSAASTATASAAAATAAAAAAAAADTNQMSARTWNCPAAASRHGEPTGAEGGQARQTPAPRRLPTISPQCGFPAAPCYAPSPSPPYTHMGCAALPMQWDRFSLQAQQQAVGEYLEPTT